MGDGAQPLLSSAYGAADATSLRHTRVRAYVFALVLSVAGTAFLYATEQTTLAYILTAVEPLFMLAFMFVLPGFAVNSSMTSATASNAAQMMIWWSTVLARILTAVLALVFQAYATRKELAGKR